MVFFSHLPLTQVVAVTELCCSAAAVAVALPPAGVRQRSGELKGLT